MGAHRGLTSSRTAFSDQTTKCEAAVFVVRIRGFDGEDSGCVAVS